MLVNFVVVKIKEAEDNRAGSLDLNYDVHCRGLLVDAGLNFLYKPFASLKLSQGNAIPALPAYRMLPSIFVKQLQSMSSL
jgi:hypothetical protein